MFICVFSLLGAKKHFFQKCLKNGLVSSENSKRKTMLFTQPYSRWQVFNTPYQKSVLRSSKWPPNTPKFCDLSYYHMTYLKSIFFVFSQWFWVFKRGWLQTHPHLLTYIFNPTANRVNPNNTGLLDWMLLEYGGDCFSLHAPSRSPNTLW